jgi:hypothetical protein
LTFEAYGRTRSPALRTLALGLAVITLGASSPVSSIGSPRSIRVSPSSSKARSLPGFAIALYSLYVD